MTQFDGIASTVMRDGYHTASYIAMGLFIRNSVRGIASSVVCDGYHTAMGHTAMGLFIRNSVRDFA